MFFCIVEKRTNWKINHKMNGVKKVLAKAYLQYSRKKGLVEDKVSRTRSNWNSTTVRARARVDTIFVRASTIDGRAIGGNDLDVKVWCFFVVWIVRVLLDELNEYNLPSVTTSNTFVTFILNPSVCSRLTLMDERCKLISLVTSLDNRYLQAWLRLFPYRNKYPPLYSWYKVWSFCFR